MSDWAVNRNSAGLADTPTGTWNSRIDGGAANGKGTWTEAKSALSFDCLGIVVTFQTQPNNYQILDIGIGAGGSEQVIVPNWNLSSSLSGTHANNPQFIPVFIPAGSRVALRSQAHGGAAFATFKIVFITGAYGGVQAPQRWKDYTQIAGPPYGVATTPGNPSKGSYAQIAAATEFSSTWVSVAVQGATSPEDINIDIATGAASSEVVVIPDLYYSIENLGVQWCFPFTIPAGSRIAARAATNGGTTAMGIAVHIGA